MAKNGMRVLANLSRAELTTYALIINGSHKVLIDVIHEELAAMSDVEVKLITLSGKKWHWRARTSALYFAENIPVIHNLNCVLPLHELLGLRPDLHSCKKVVYFHENQLVYPVRKSQNRDFQYGYNQILTCLAADLVLFNSQFNQDSFLGNIKSFFKLQPDFRPKNLDEKIKPKCQVLYFPLKITSPILPTDLQHTGKHVLSIVWPHRWEFDKNPEMFFRVLSRLVKKGKTNFRINVLGESFKDNPAVFEEAKTEFKNYIDHFGYVTEKSDYYQILQRSDIVVSTANHEFFGVAMLEGVQYGCFPLAPNNLVYPEIFDFEMCLYNSEETLLNKLMLYLDDPTSFSQHKNRFFSEFSLEKYSWKTLKSKYISGMLS